MFQITSAGSQGSRRHLGKKEEPKEYLPTSSRPQSIGVESPNIQVVAAAGQANQLGESNLGRGGGKLAKRPSLGLGNGSRRGEKKGCATTGYEDREQGPEELMEQRNEMKQQMNADEGRKERG